MSRTASLIVNPAAGGGRAASVLPAVEAALARHGVAFHTERTRDIEHACALAEQTLHSQEVAVVLSGDGLVGAIAGVLAHKPGALLGVLPGGRGNDLARVLGIPRDPEEACAVIAGGVERELDLGEVEGRPFIGIASVGFDSDANRIANEAPARLGNLVYAYGALRALAQWKPARFEIELRADAASDADAVRHSFVGYSVAAANSKAYGGGMFLAPDAELDDGMLDVVVSEQVSKRRFAASLPKVFKGTHIEDPSVHVYRAPAVRIAADRPFVVYADGDPIGELPVVVRALPRALRVLVPSRSA